MKDILVKPLVTEKSMSRTGLGEYVFRVGKNANKPQIARAIEDLYKVKAVKINIINLKQEKVLSRGKHLSKKKAWKKAIIRLKKGQKISAFEEKKNA